MENTSSKRSFLEASPDIVEGQDGDARSKYSIVEEFPEIGDEKNGNAYLQSLIEKSSKAKALATSVEEELKAEREKRVNALEAEIQSINKDFEASKATQLAMETHSHLRQCWKTKKLEVVKAREDVDAAKSTLDRAEQNLAMVGKEAAKLDKEREAANSVYLKRLTRST